MCNVQIINQKADHRKLSSTSTIVTPRYRIVREQNATKSVATTRLLEDTSMAPNRRLKQARELRGWSQARVAEKIGTDATTVSRWERGLFSPTPYFREKLCKLFEQNAEELGLLESADQSGGYERSNSFHAFPTPIPLFQANGEWQKEAEYVESASPFLPPSWPKRSDTFSYILRSAMHDQQAHMLWGDAYVRALQGQRTEAQQLGEASLSAFERVGHLNATAVREWLNQRELIPPSPPSTSRPPSSPGRPPMPPAILPEQHKRPARRFLSGKRAGIILMLLLLVTLGCAELLANQQGPTALASPPAAFVSPAAQTTAPARTQTPAARATAPVSTSGSSNAISAITQAPALTVQVSPASLAPQDCPQESLGYRCTLTFWLSTPNNQGQIPWRASSNNLSAQFNPLAGTDSPGSQVQVIAYVKSASGQRGQLVFTFTFASHVYTTSVSWQG